MSDQGNDKNEDDGCCKGFNEEACLCIDKETGEKNCGTDDNKDCCDTEKDCCAPSNDCCPS